MSIRFLLLTIAPPVIGVVIGYLVGGRLAGFQTIRIRALWLVWVAAAAQFAQYYVPGLAHAPMLAVVFGLVLVWLALNLWGWPFAVRLAGLAIVLGASLNGLVVALNGRMPCSPAAVAAAGGQVGVETPKNVPADAGTRLAPLGDVIPLPGLRKVLSPGDLFIGCGAAALVVAAMRRRPGGESAPLSTGYRKELIV